MSGYGEYEAKMAWLDKLKKHASKKMMEGVQSQFAPKEEPLEEQVEAAPTDELEMDENALAALIGE
jgi:hypothetical protein